MPNTTNFNWPTPADTDLVKDGAAAIRNLGDGVDTSLVDLKGGTTGQILSKASNADMDFAFITPNVGDLTEVQAGTGISVADGTGPIPIVTNTVATEFDAKGDLVVGTGSDTFDRLAVGTDGYTLVADSAETLGVKWAAPTTPSFVGAYAYRNNSSLSVPATTDTVITLPDEAFDTNTYHSTATNTGRMTIPTGYGGKYLVQAYCQLSTASAGYVTLRIYKNGAAIAEGYSSGQISRVFGSSSDIHSGSLIINLSANDYIEMVMFNENALTCIFGVLSVKYLGA